MKLGVFAVLFGQKSLEEALTYIKGSGLDAVEIACGGYPGKSHCDPAALLADKDKYDAFRRTVQNSGLEISALSCHGNPLHPNKETAAQYHEDFRNTVLLAEKLGVKTVITFSGCPGESEQSQNPVWVTCAWPDEYAAVEKWQWEQKVIPYWREQDRFVKEHGVRVAIEAHPGFVVYNTETMLRLRNECGDSIGINFDPSHLFWQGMDPVVALKALGKAGAVFHFHAKDTAIEPANTALNGVLDTKSYRDEMNRSWIFRSVGYGHGTETWRPIISMLQLIGYDGAISIEHEDSLMSIEEGFQKAVAFLKDSLIHERLTEIWWA